MVDDSNTVPDVQAIRARTGDCVDTGLAKIASRGGRPFA
jgi:hypothetical protein